MAETSLLTITSKDLEALSGRLTRAQREFADIVGREFERYGKELADAVREEAPVKTGELRDSVKYYIKGKGTRNVELQVTIGNAKRPEVVVKSLLLGSLPHVIRPRRPGGVLAFEVNGQRVFAKRVRHPGTTRDPFFNRALRKTDSARRRMIARVGALTVERITD